MSQHYMNRPRIRCELDNVENLENEVERLKLITRQYWPWTVEYITSNAKIKKLIPQLVKLKNKQNNQLNHVTFGAPCIKRDTRGHNERTVINEQLNEEDDYWDYLVTMMAWIMLIPRTMFLNEIRMMNANYANKVVSDYWSLKLWRRYI